MIKSRTETVDRDYALEDRRAFLKLPLEERRRLLVKQAAQIVGHYEQPAESIERQDWQGGDIVECS